MISGGDMKGQLFPLGFGITTAGRMILALVLILVLILFFMFVLTGGADWVAKLFTGGGGLFGG
jgi:hypothetical protein